MSVHWGGSYQREPFAWSPLRKALARLACQCESDAEGGAAAPGTPPSRAAAASPWASDRR